MSKQGNRVLSPIPDTAAEIVAGSDVAVDIMNWSSRRRRPVFSDDDGDDEVEETVDVDVGKEVTNAAADDIDDDEWNKSIATAVVANLTRRHWRH